jgi:hypothetical protein
MFVRRQRRRELFDDEFGLSQRHEKQVRLALLKQAGVHRR